MNLTYSDPSPFTSNLLGSTNDLIMQPYASTPGPVNEEDSLMMSGGKKSKPKSKPKAKPKAKTSPKPKSSPKPKAKSSPKPKTKVEKKVKLIDTFKKADLEKKAKKYEVCLKTRDGKVKTKEQLFNSLKRKKLI